MWLSLTILIIINMATQGLIWCGFCVVLYDRACCNDCTCSPNKRFKYSNIFVRNLRIFEYIRDLTFWCFEYSNIFVSQFFYIRIRILNIRRKIFEYSNIFEYSLCSGIKRLQPNLFYWFYDFHKIKLQPFADSSHIYMYMVWW